MRIALCASLDFTQNMKQAAERLKELGHSAIIPKTSELILGGKVSLERIMEEKASGRIHKRMARLGILRYYFEKIKESDAILVLNIDKKKTRGYIGGNTFLEMGFAHVLGKKIFLLNGIPDMPYTEEIRAMRPKVLNGRLEKIK